MPPESISDPNALLIHGFALYFVLHSFILPIKPVLLFIVYYAYVLSI